MVIKKLFSDFNMKLFLAYFSVFLVFVAFFVLFMEFNYVAVGPLGGKATQVKDISPVAEADFGDGPGEISVEGGNKPKTPESGGSGSGGSGGSGGSSGSSSGDKPKIPDSIVGEVKEEFKPAILEVEPLIDPRDFIAENNLGLSSLVGEIKEEEEIISCGQYSCDVVQECARQTNTRASLSSNEITSGIFKKSLCVYENSKCDAKIVYEPCSLTKSFDFSADVEGLKEVIAQGSEDNSNSALEGESSQAGGSSSSLETKIGISDSSGVVNLATLVLNSEERKLSVNLGEKPKTPDFCFNGQKEASEEMIDCGFICNKSCGKDDDKLKVIRLVFWWLFLLVTILLVADLSKER